MGETETPDAAPLTFADVQDEQGNDVLLARDVEAMTAKERSDSRANIRRLVAELQATARPINDDPSG